jgi:hypothetical protein
MPDRVSGQRSRLGTRPSTRAGQPALGGLVAGIALAAGIVMSSGAAGASPTLSGAGGPGSAGSPETTASSSASPAVLGPARSSTDFAGYQYLGGGTIQASSMTVSADVTVPRVTCSSKKHRAVEASVGMYASDGKFVSAGVFLGCYQKSASYFPVLALTTKNKKYDTHKAAVHPGDLVALTTTVMTSGSAASSPGSAVVSVTDKTTHVSRTLKGRWTVADGWNGPWVGDTSWLDPKVLGVPTFRSVTFKHCRLDSGPLDTQSTQGYQRVTTKGVVQIALGSFSPDGQSFTTKYRHS